jgi:hypothetical protein
MTTAHEHGPGLAWLADRAGCTPEELLAHPRRLVDALAGAGRALTGMTLRLGSEDPDVRVDAEREADQLRRTFVDTPDPGERFRAKILGALREATDRVRAAGGDRDGKTQVDPGWPDDPMPPEQESRR